MTFCLDILHQCDKRVKIKCYKVLGASFWKNWSGGLFAPLPHPKEGEVPHIFLQGWTLIELKLICSRLSFIDLNLVLNICLMTLFNAYFCAICILSDDRFVWQVKLWCGRSNTFIHFLDYAFFLVILDLLFTSCTFIRE